MRRIRFHEVESSNIKAVGYQRAKKVLHVLFLNGGYYVYYGVSRRQFDNFRKAESKGRFFIRKIKNQYRFVKMLMEQEVYVCRAA